MTVGRDWDYRYVLIYKDIYLPLLPYWISWKYWRSRELRVWVKWSREYTRLLVNNEGVFRHREQEPAGRPKGFAV